MSSVIMPQEGIHPTAVIHPNAVLGKNVSVGPYAVIDEDVVIGDNCVIGAHVTIHRYTTIGKNNRFFPGCSIGAEPQDLKFVGEKSYTIIGDGGTFRECCTVNRGCGEEAITKIGDNILMMAYTHVAHNCIVGNDVIMSNVATLAGHVVVDNKAIIGGLAAVHQFTQIGRNAMIGGMARISQDVPPYMIVAGDPAFVSGLNSVGLARSGMPAEERSELKKAFRILYRNGLTLKEAIASLEADLTQYDAIVNLIEFLRKAERGILRTRK